MKTDKEKWSRQVHIKEIVKIEFFPIAALIIWAILPLLNHITFEFYDGLWNWYSVLITGISLVLVVLLFIQKKLAFPSQFRKNLPIVFFALWIGWMIISTMCNELLHNQLSYVIQVQAKNACFVTYFVLALLLPTAKQRQLWLDAFLYPNTVIALLVTGRFYATPNYSHADGYNNLYDVFYNANHLAFYLMMGLLCAAVSFLLTKDHRKQIILSVITIIEFSALIIADTLGCMIALGFGLVFIIIVFLLCKQFNWKKYILLIALLFLTVVSMCVLPNNDFIRTVLLGNGSDISTDLAAITDPGSAPDMLGSGRLVLWRTTLRCISEKPILGQGIKNLREALLEKSVNWSVHNEYLEIAGFYGLPALLFYLAAIFSVFLRGLKNRQKLTILNLIGLCTTFTYLVSACFGVATFYTAPYMFIFLGLGYYKEEEKPAEG